MKVNESELDNFNGGYISQDDNGQWWVFADDYSQAFPAKSHDDAWQKSLAHDWWPIEVKWPFGPAKEK